MHRTGRGRWLVAGALAAASVAVVPAAAGQRSGASSFAVGVPTVVDPVRGAAEPIIEVTNDGGAWVSGPGGTGTQTSWFFRSRDRGLTYSLLGPPGGHWVCGHTGGGDSWLLYDHATADMYVTDQEALASLATGKVDGRTGELTAKCLSTPAMSADRSFYALLPGGSRAPQVRDSGGKPVLYMSWLCPACGGGTSGQPGGIAFAWSNNGSDWHAADPGVPVDTLVTDQFFSASAITSTSWHGTMAADPRTGYVYKALACGVGACPKDIDSPEFGIAIGKPGQGRTDPSNVGQFESVEYRTAAASDAAGKPFEAGGNLFPIITRDRAGTLYLAWIQDDSHGVDEAPDPSAWHLYYVYSKDGPAHRTWSKPIRVDRGPTTATSVFGWMTAGDPGRLGFVWLGSKDRRNPSAPATTREWYPHLAITTNGDTPRPSFQQARAGDGPSHIGDICLLGTACGATVPPGNRNMADFVSVDVGPDGVLQAAYANDANRAGRLPTDLVKGVPIPEVVRQVSGPRLVGGGVVDDVRFSAAPTAGPVADRHGDAPTPALDLRSLRVAHRAGALEIRVGAASLAATSPPAGTPGDQWWLVRWKQRGQVRFAAAQLRAGEAPVFVAGEPGAYSRPGLTYYTVPTLLDFREGVPVTGRREGNDWVLRVPLRVVGARPGELLESVTAFSLVASSLPPYVLPGTGNVPHAVDATPAVNLRLR